MLMRDMPLYLSIFMKRFLKISLANSVINTQILNCINLALFSIFTFKKRLDLQRESVQPYKSKKIGFKEAIRFGIQ